MKKKPRRRGPASPYPWDRWIRKRKNRLTLHKGKDFHCQLRSMDVQIRSQAIRRGLAASTCHDELAGVITVWIRKG
jgi:hypothetical protein